MDSQRTEIVRLELMARLALTAEERGGEEARQTAWLEKVRGRFGART